MSEAALRRAGLAARLDTRMTGGGTRLRGAIAGRRTRIPTQEQTRACSAFAARAVGTRAACRTHIGGAPAALAGRVLGTRITISELAQASATVTVEAVRVLRAGIAKVPLVLGRDASGGAVTDRVNQAKIGRIIHARGELRACPELAWDRAGLARARARRGASWRRLAQ